MVDVTSQEVSLASGDEGHLIFLDDKLAAVVSRLDGDDHLAEHRGTYFIEAGFSPDAIDGSKRLFGSLEQAARWLLRRSTSASDHCCGGCGG